jgi:putative transposase
VDSHLKCNSLRKISGAGRGAEDDEGIAIFGGTESVHPEAGSRRDASGRDLPQGRDQPGDVLQLEEEVRWLLPTEMRRLNQLEDENNKLRRVVADLSLDKEMLQDVIRRKL